MDRSSHDNIIIDQLINATVNDPVPAEHLSSHWLRHYNNTIVEKTDKEFVLGASGFGSMHSRSKILTNIGKWIERLSYRHLTRNMVSYAAIWKTAEILAANMGFDRTTNVWNQAMGLSIVADHFHDHGLRPNVFALIGDGHGFLGTLIKKTYPESKIYNIDLPKMLVFQAYAHSKARSGTMAMISDDSFDSDASIFFAAPHHIDKITESIDCAINMASMGEMSESSIATYFEFLRARSHSHSRFYCVNRLEKRLIGGEVTRIYDYPWKADDEVFIDELCAFYHHIISYSTSVNGPRILGKRVPFINFPDGQVIHRLVRLQNNS